MFFSRKNFLGIVPPPKCTEKQYLRVGEVGRQGSREVGKSVVGLQLGRYSLKSKSKIFESSFAEGRVKTVLRYPHLIKKNPHPPKGGRVFHVEHLCAYFLHTFAKNSSSIAAISALRSLVSSSEIFVINTFPTSVILKVPLKTSKRKQPLNCKPYSAL